MENNDQKICDHIDKDLKQRNVNTNQQGLQTISLSDLHDKFFGTVHSSVPESWYSSVCSQGTGSWVAWPSVRQERNCSSLAAGTEHVFAAG